MRTIINKENFMNCDRNICYQNEINDIECEDCEVAKAYKKERYKIHVDVENIVCACDDSYVTYECFVPELLLCEDNPRFNFYISGKEMKSWPEYIFCLKIGNCFIYNHVPDDVKISSLIKNRYYIADKWIDYYYRIREIKGIEGVKIT